MRTNQLALIENQVDILNLTRRGLMSSRQIRRALNERSVAEVERRTRAILEGDAEIPRDVRALLVRESYINKYYLMMMYDGSPAGSEYIDMLSEQSFLQNVGNAVGKTFSDYGKSAPAQFASRVGQAVATTIAHPIDSVKRAASEIWSEVSVFDSLVQLFIMGGSMIPVVKTAAGITGVGYYLKEVYDNIKSGNYIQATLSCILAVMSAAVIEPTPITSTMGPFMKAWATFKNMLASIGGGAIKTVADLSSKALYGLCQSSPALAGVVGWISRFSVGVLANIERSAGVIFGDLMELVTKWGPKLGLPSGTQTAIIEFVGAKLGSLAGWAGQLAETLFFAGNDEAFKILTTSAVETVLASKSNPYKAGKQVASQAVATAARPYAQVAGQAISGAATKVAAAGRPAPVTAGYAANTTGQAQSVRKV